VDGCDTPWHCQGGWHGKEARMKYLHLIVLCLIMTACSLSNTNGIKLEGTRWRLQSLSGHELRANTAITLQFDAEIAHGRGGCNNYGSNYIIQPKNGLKVSEGAWTEMLCAGPEGVMEQESEYATSFWSVTSYKREGTTLLLANEQKGIRLQYQLLPKFEVNPRDLIGKTWQLVSVTGWDGVALSSFTLRFDGSKFSGTTICRPYAGTYQANDDSLRFLSLGMTTDVNCSEKDQIAEGEYTTFLSNVWQYNVSKTQLELYTDSGKKLVFELASQK
jgi:heat shock protein HslJ